MNLKKLLMLLTNKKEFGYKVLRDLNLRDAEEVTIPLFNLNIIPENPLKSPVSMKAEANYLHAQEHLFGGCHVLASGRLIRGHNPLLSSYNAYVAMDYNERPGELEIIPEEGRIALPFDVFRKEDSYVLKSNSTCGSKIQISGEPEFILPSPHQLKMML